MRPRMLDLFACEGGASAGYTRAGWDVHAVDLDRNRLNRNPHAHTVADALEFVAAHGHEYQAVHASPPCQFYTRGNAPLRQKRAAGEPIPDELGGWPRLIPQVREALNATGLPYVIENVEDAAWDLHNPVTLCGCMFDLSTVDTDGVRIHLKRPRLFESNVPLSAPRPCAHDGIEWWAGAYGGARRDKYEAKFVRRGGYVPPDKNVVKALLGVEHDMTWRGLFECIPPAYAHHIGYQLADHLKIGAAA